MPTNKQKQYVKAKIVDKSSTEKQLLAKAGYSEAVQIKPTQVTRSKGVQELIAKANLTEGLDDRSVLGVISQAINQRDYKKGATVALNWLNLKYKTNTPQQDNRKITVNPDIDKLDKQAHQYIAQKYNLQVQELKNILQRKRGGGVKRNKETQL